MEINIGSKIRKVRKVKEFSQEYMAISLGITQNSYSKLENQKTKLSLELINKISEILEIDFIDLISFDENSIFDKNNNMLDNNFSKELKELYEDQIIHLKEEIIFLQKQLSNE
ncbi:MAG: helix-turn-helix domain-containing protein [Polaribacter sp.]